MSLEGEQGWDGPCGSEELLLPLGMMLGTGGAWNREMSSPARAEGTRSSPPLTHPLNIILYIMLLLYILYSIE